MLLSFASAGHKSKITLTKENDSSTTDRMADRCIATDTEKQS